MFLSKSGKSLNLSQIFSQISPPVCCHLHQFSLLTKSVSSFPTKYWLKLMLINYNHFCRSIGTIQFCNKNFQHENCRTNCFKNISNHINAIPANNILKIMSRQCSLILEIIDVFNYLHLQHNLHMVCNFCSISPRNIAMKQNPAMAWKV